VTFDGSGSQSAAGINSYQWDFGDGAQASGAIVTHAFAQPGDYQVTLTVTDGNNLRGSTNWVISILPPATPQPPPPPVAVIIAPPTGDSATPVIFDGSASISDAGITSYVWSMGDGTNLDGAVVEHTYPTAGNYIVSLTVTDAFGQTGATTWSIMIYAAVATLPDASQPLATPEIPVETATPTP
jgi:PKD repeat protein